MAETPVMRVWDGAIRLFHWGIASLLMISVVSVNAGRARPRIASGLAMGAALLFPRRLGLCRQPAGAMRGLRADLPAPARAPARRAALLSACAAGALAFPAWD